ncbi:MAG TPA: cytochrome c oxidase subunit II [Chloroflexota bacterium]|nr:cytochrome c oxidase subunit II [Chloroflexota bacterium]
MRPGSHAHLKAVPLTAMVVLGAAVLAGCQQAPAAIFRPESPGATAIHNLSLYLLAVAGVALVGVEVTLFLAVARFSNRPEEEAVQTHGNLKLETGWTAATAIVVFITLGLTVNTMVDVTANIAESPPSLASAMPLQSAWPGDTLPMRVVGHQWWWTFEYPQQGIVTANEAHVPVGDTVRAQLESGDVIHSFWAPRLGGKTDMIPGQINYTSFLAATIGSYTGECAEFCGVEHAHMGFTIVVDSPADFSDWVAGQQAPAASAGTDAERAGYQTFTRSCGVCHTINGTEARGKSGPNLTHLASRQMLAANTLENNPTNLARWIQDPQGLKPGNLMPNQKLDQQQISDLVAYLSILK